MTKLLFIIFICFSNLGFSSSDENPTVKIESYIVRLAEKALVSDAQLLRFAEQLEKNELVNVFDCETSHCTAIEKMHLDNFEEHLANELDIASLKVWMKSFLTKRKIERCDRKETQQKTLNLHKIVPRRISSGEDYACAINKDEHLECFSSIFYDGKPVPLSKYLVAPSTDLGAVTQVLSVDKLTCVLTNLGSVRCFGTDNSFQELESLQGIVQMDAGYFYDDSDYKGHIYVCALRGEGLVSCGDTGLKALVPEDLKNVIQVAVMGPSACALLSNGKPRCWSLIGGAHKPVFNIPTDLPFIVSIASSGVWSSTLLACALDIDGTQYCWTDSGQLKIFDAPKDSGQIVQISVDCSYWCHIYLLDQNGKITKRDFDDGRLKDSHLLSILSPSLQFSVRYNYLYSLSCLGTVECIDFDRYYKNVQAKIDLLTEGLPVLPEGICKSNSEFETVETTVFN